MDFLLILQSPITREVSWLLSLEERHSYVFIYVDFFGILEMPTSA